MAWSEGQYGYSALVDTSVANLVDIALKRAGLLVRHDGVIGQLLLGICRVWEM